MSTRTLPATTYRKALELWHAALAEAGMPQILSSEVVRLQEASGRVPARVLRTKLPSPSHAVAAMDGYAVSAERIAPAAKSSPIALSIGEEAIAVDTGSALPPGCDTIVPFENTERTAHQVRIFNALAIGKHVRLAGEDVPPGVIVGRPGRPLRPIDCAALISCGEIIAEVVRRPLLTIIPTGNELLAPGAQSAAGAAFESNSTMIGAAAQALGAQVRVLPLMRDHADDLQAVLRSAAASSDVVLLLAGSSRGSRDQSFNALSAAGTVVVRGVASRPARPANLGLIGAVPVINLPGYPVASQVAFNLYAAPLIRRLAGYKEERGHPAAVADSITARGDADEWRGVNLEESARQTCALEEDEYTSGLYSLQQSDALLHVPLGKTELPAGHGSTVQLLRPLADFHEPLFFGPYDPLIEELAVALDFRCRWTAGVVLSDLEQNSARLGGMSGVDVGRIEQALQSRPALSFKVLGRRIEGTAVAGDRVFRNGQRLSGDAAWPDPDAWSGAAAVAAGLVPAASCSSYVADRFGLELIEPQSIWYVMVWHGRREQEHDWIMRLDDALRALRPAARSLGWELIEGE